ncbi:HEAT repeat domain-containing protein [Flavobacterium sp. ACN6]|uniref:HEAT repeat domain-containing protein n=1 Tax=Flavobacterium sp. ACN6 TaxID=1920426 RepID=UPI000BB39F31|nr:HEAT repeat domain-containing protein [Flavobacterium sp. ACN6]PBJ14604.1 hypothetical protein BSF42_10260 [Flavobacterium sp. ACN6]
MITIQELQEDYKRFKEENSLQKNIFKLKKELLSSDSDNFLEFHYEISYDLSLKDGIRNMIKSFFYADVDNNRDKNKVAAFLYGKYLEILNNKGKGELLRMLGHLRIPLAKELAEKEISSPDYDLRYNSIIVLGWTGTPKDLDVLNNRMIKDSNPLLRGYCATSMRQIWHRNPDTKNEIVLYIYNAIHIEKDNDALVGMIITIQDLYMRKFGIKESHYGDISGNVTKAKGEVVKFLNKTIKL